MEVKIKRGFLDRLFKTSGKRLLNENFKRAKTEIEVYKIYYKKPYIWNADGSRENKFVSIYQDQKVHLGETLPLVQITSFENSLRKHYVTLSIHKGYHSFLTENDAIRYLNSSGMQISNKVIIKCLIPKGAKYIEGDYEGFKNIVSEQIKIVKVCA